MSLAEDELDLSPAASLLADERAFLRVWTATGSPHRTFCFVLPGALGADPALFGIALVDCARHGARAWARAVGISEAQALERIWQSLDVERYPSTDDPVDPTDRGVTH